jgi:feruloyl esterase
MNVIANVNRRLVRTLTFGAIVGVTGMAVAAVGVSYRSDSNGYAALGVVKPVVGCSNLIKADLSQAADAPWAVKSAQTVDTAQGSFCVVVAEIEPSIVLTISLPVERWTQRYIQNGGGEGEPGSRGYGQGGTCAPALNGEFVVGYNNLGRWLPGTAPPGTAVEYWNWSESPQKRIDYAYRANHLESLVAKALMQVYYGQAPRYSYFIGCSEGGREALTEAQRYPEDFNGISAGAPAILETAQETTFHLWIVRADKRPDGTNILMPDKLKLAHDAVLAKCDTMSGLKDGLLQDPLACDFDPATIRCPRNAQSTAGCLTAEEVGALKKLYSGDEDDEGHPILFGLARGGEALWDLPKTATAEHAGARRAALALAYQMLPEIRPAAADYDHMQFTAATFREGSQLSPLYDSANTNLKQFAAQGGKLILWHGLADFRIPPEETLAYYHGVQHFMGAQATDGFLRLFMIPGVGHCSGGDGYDQFDVLGPLMSWTEVHHAPNGIITGKAERGSNPPEASSIGAAAKRAATPFAAPLLKLSATRPVFPYPAVARYIGKGAPADAINYESARSRAPIPATKNYEALKLVGPDNQHQYAVKDGRVTVQPDKPGLVHHTK